MKLLPADKLQRLLPESLKEQLKLQAEIVWDNLSEENREALRRILGVEAGSSSNEVESSSNETEEHILRALQEPPQLTQEKLRQLFTTKEGDVPDHVEVLPRLLGGATIVIRWQDGTVDETTIAEHQLRLLSDPDVVVHVVKRTGGLLQQGHQEDKHPH